MRLARPPRGRLDVARRSGHRISPSRPLRPLRLPGRPRSGDVPMSGALRRHRPQGAGKPERPRSCLLDQSERPAAGRGSRTTGRPAGDRRGTPLPALPRRCGSRRQPRRRAANNRAAPGTIRNSCGLKTRPQNAMASYELLNRVAELCLSCRCIRSDLGDGSASCLARPVWSSRDARRRRRSVVCHRCSCRRSGVCSREKQQAPDFRGILPSVSYAPFDGTGASRRRQPSQRRQNPRRHENARAADPRDPAVFLDRRRRTGAADRQ